LKSRSVPSLVIHCGVATATGVTAQAVVTAVGGLGARCYCRVAVEGVQRVTEDINPNPDGLLSFAETENCPHAAVMYMYMSAVQSRG
jgi:hypothetical protein